MKIIVIRIKYQTSFNQVLNYEKYLPYSNSFFYPFFFCKKERVPFRNRLTHSFLLFVTMLMIGNSIWAQAPPLPPLRQQVWLQERL